MSLVSRATSLVAGAACLGVIVAGSFAAAESPADSCEFPRGVQDLEFSASRYPGIRSHYVAAVRDGWPRVLLLERTGTGDRRDRLLRGTPIKEGYDRDEYPPAVGRTGWLGHVDYVRSSENRSHGASLGAQLRGLCDGVRFRYVWKP